MLKYFQWQTYQQKELLVIEDGENSSELFAGVPGVRHVYLGASCHPVGYKRNYGCGISRGGVICHWDDDDWYGPERIAEQVAQLLAGADITGYNRALFHDIRGQEVREWYGGENYALGSSFAYWRRRWERKPFPNTPLGEDVDFWNDSKPRIACQSGIGRIVVRDHGRNTDPRGERPNWPVVPMTALPKAYEAQLGVL